MRVGVIAKRISPSAPCLENGNIIRDLLQLLRIDEAVDHRHVLIVKRPENRLRDFKPRLSRRQIAVRRQIVEGKCNLLRNRWD